MCFCETRTEFINIRFVDIRLQIIKPQNYMDPIRGVACLNSRLQLNFNYPCLKMSKVQ
jgi:hypothetical protein